MQAVIIAAGKGMRMRPLTDKTPKPLLKVGEKSIVERNLDQLKGLAEEVILVVGYKGKLIHQHLGKQYKGIKLTYVWQKEQKGTGAAARLALPYLKGEFLLMYGDDLYQRKDILRVFKYCPSILLGRTENPSQFGVVETKRRWVTNIIEKPKNPKSTLVNTGLYFLDPSVFNTTIRKSKRGEYEFPDYLKHLLKKGNLAFCVTKDWQPISTLEDLRKARLALKKTTR